MIATLKMTSYAVACQQGGAKIKLEILEMLFI